MVGRQESPSSEKPLLESLSEFPRPKSEPQSPVRPAVTPPTSMETVAKVLPPNFPLIHVCLYCGVKFSSPNTLQAHVAFYCSKKPSPEALASLAAGLSHSPIHSPGSATSSSSSSLKRTADMVMKEEGGSPLPSPALAAPSTHSPELPVLHQVTSISPRPPSLQSPANSVHSNSSHSNHSPANTSSSTLPSPPAAKTPRTAAAANFSCGLCGYTCDKRSSLNRHMKVHDERPASPKERVPLSQLYCHECDIQFRSRTTFQGHKEMYCEARRRNQGGGSRNAAASPVSPPPVPSVSPRGVGSSTATSPELPGPVSPQRAALMAQAAVNSIMQHSMNQAAVVMAPVVAPNGLTYNIPTVIMQPLIGPMQANTVTAHSNNQASTSNSTTSPKASGKIPSSSTAEQPLDLSVKKDEGDDKKPEDGHKAEHPPPPPSPAPVTPRSHASPALSPARAASPSPPTPVPILIQPTPRHISKCNECNIVFYKMENYLAHKEHYCSARHSSSSMDSPAIEEERPESAVTPRASSPPPPPQASLPLPPHPHAALQMAGEHNFFQFYCIPCKIKFSSRDTLQAHQGFYCPARKLPGATTEAGEVPGRSDGDEHNDLGYQCTQCQGRFPSARLLKLHLCPVATVPIPLFRCTYCDFIAQSDSRLIEHIKAHAPSKAYRCTLCGYRGNTVRGMRMHGKTHIDGGENFTDDNMVEFEEPPLIPKRIKAMNVPEQPIDIEGEIMRLKNQPYKRRRSTKMYCYAEHMRKHRCEDCNDWFMTEAKLREHLKLHAEKRSLKCASCEFVADSEASLAWHTKLMHESSSRSESSTSRHSPTKTSCQVKLEPREEEEIKVEDSVETRKRPRSTSPPSTTTTAPAAATTSPVLSPDARSPKVSPGGMEYNDLIKSEPDSTSDTENLNTSSAPAPQLKLQNGGCNSSNTTSSSSRPTTPLSPSPVVNAASSVRGKITPEMAAILVPKNEKPAAAPPFCSKQWDAGKCNECNIVFHKMENYIAHKEHYCSGRRSSSVY